MYKDGNPLQLSIEYTFKNLEEFSVQPRVSNNFLSFVQIVFVRVMKAFFIITDKKGFQFY